jgi:hypothetical protein
MTMAEQERASWAAFVSGDGLSLSNVLLLILFAVLVYSKLADWNVFYMLKLIVEFMVPVPLINVTMTAAESDDDGVTSKPAANVDLKDPKRPGFIQCYDPSTKQRLGEVTAMTAQDVHELCVKAAHAQKAWAKTSFAERRKVLRTIQKYIVHHVEDICRVCTRDSGKPKVDALLGEVMTTCEKIRCTNANGELWLRKSYRPTGPVMMHKTAYVEYVPLGVLGVIAPWNYPVSITFSCWTMPLHRIIANHFSNSVPQHAQSHHLGYFRRKRSGGKSLGAHVMVC